VDGRARVFVAVVSQSIFEVRFEETTSASATTLDVTTTAPSAAAAADRRAVARLEAFDQWGFVDCMVNRGTRLYVSCKPGTALVYDLSRSAAARSGVGDADGKQCGRPIGCVTHPEWKEQALFTMIEDTLVFPTDTGLMVVPMPPVRPLTRDVLTARRAFTHTDDDGGGDVGGGDDGGDDDAAPRL
jgi:hypothetical protein